MTHATTLIQTITLAMGKGEFAGYLLVVLVPLLVIAAVFVKRMNSQMKGMLEEADALAEAGEFARAVEGHKNVLRHSLAQVDSMQFIPAPLVERMERFGWPALERMEAIYAEHGVAFDRRPLTLLMTELHVRAQDPHTVGADLMPLPAAKPVLDDLSSRFGACIDAMPTL